MEELIEAKLQENFAVEDVNAFYEDFKNNYSMFEEMDSQAFDVIVACIDFEKFKAQMLKYKADFKLAKEQSSNNKETSSGPNIEYDDNQKQYERYIGEDLSDPALQWKKST